MWHTLINFTPSTCIQDENVRPVQPFIQCKNVFGWVRAAATKESINENIQQKYILYSNSFQIKQALLPTYCKWKFKLYPTNAPAYL